MKQSNKWKIEGLLKMINDKHILEEYDVSNAPHYGGWNLTANKGSRTVCHRLPPKEFKAYLNGIIHVLGALEEMVHQSEKIGGVDELDDFMKHRKEYEGIKRLADLVAAQQQVEIIRERNKL